MNTFLLTALGIGKALWIFIAPLLAKQTAAILTALLPAARDAVLVLYRKDIDGGAKRTEAIARVKELAKAKGIEATDNLVNLAVELALQHVKAVEEGKPVAKPEVKNEVPPPVVPPAPVSTPAASTDSGPKPSPVEL